jgi:RNA polymerase sigma factor (sigma-70 family)
VTSQPIPVGELLLRYLDGNSPENPDDLLALLVIDYAQPVIRRTVGARLPQSQPEEREDIASDALAALIGRLAAMRSNPAEKVTVANFEAYAAGVAANTVHAYVAAKFPARSRLRRRIRFALTSDRRLGIVESAEGLWVCGLAEHTGRSPARAGDLEACRREMASRRLPGQLTEFLAILFSDLAQPAELNDLTSLAADLLGVTDRAPAAEDLEQTLPDPQPAPAEQAEMRAWLARLWQEIRALPDGQRAALLLNLRTPQGAALGLIGDLGVAPFRELAETVGMTREELHRIWNRLPLDDLEIAERLGIGRQKVINFRSSARRRLERRMEETDRAIQISRAAVPRK